MTLGDTMTLRISESSSSPWFNIVSPPAIELLVDLKARLCHVGFTLVRLFLRKGIVFMKQKWTQSGPPR